MSREETVEFNMPLSEYPRPQFRRESYFCLNGEWDYAISKSLEKPLSYKGKILVPYSPESKLSGVGEQVFADDYLHYRRFFTMPPSFNRGRVHLNFGACDQVCRVYLNGGLLGVHEGGYNSFSFDITDSLKKGENELYICVTDDASSDVYGRGKQTYNRGGIWYTATSGLWQTVWLESTPYNYIRNAFLKPIFDEKKLEIEYEASGKGILSAQVLCDDKVVSEGISANGKIVLSVDMCEPWSPECPKLYSVKLLFGDDVVYSYFGLRKFGVCEIDGKKYFELNGRPYFQSGLLDQGYWLDGHYTPPSYQAMYEELSAVKRAGFNMIRKHIKVEPMLWYYYCDVLGLLVWQDMINGGGKYPLWRIALAPFINLHLNDGNYKKMRRSERSRAQFMMEAKEMMRQLMSCVSICLWTPFNEAWGQFDAIKVWKELSEVDNTRLFDHASGWQDMGGGDLKSKHIYFRKARMRNDGKRILALTEFGGYSYPKEGHVFSNKKFGYKVFKDEQSFTEAYVKLFRGEIVPAIKRDGLCATVYTQLTDVEDEINGIFTYDRVSKIDENVLRDVNNELYATFNEIVNNK